MSNDDFDALTDYIGAMFYLMCQIREHPSDGPRQIALSREKDDLIQQYRERLVL